MEEKKDYKILIIASGVLLVAIVGFFVLNSKSRKAEPIIVDNNIEESKVEEFILRDGMSPISGIECENWNRRPFAIMYSGSNDARQYWKNLDKADFVLEMPHRMHDEPRLMGVFQCNTPDVAGPMRSGRIDHMSVADAVGAVFVTWGKSMVAASAMNRELVDNLEVGNGTKAKDGTRAGFIDPSIKFYSANAAYADLNGIINMAADKNYEGKNSSKGFHHQGEVGISERPDYGLVDVKFNKTTYRIKYEYDKNSNSYKRFYRDAPSIDLSSGEQYAPKNIVTIITKRDSWLAEKDYEAEGLMSPWIGVPEKKVESNQYPNMQLGDPWFDTKFEGDAKFFMNGKYIKGVWKKTKGVGEAFRFYDNNGEPIKFVPGQIWMHVLAHDKRVNYDEEPEVTTGE